MLSDLRFALRQLLNAPGFSLTAIFTLALGIGACAAIFTVVNSVLLRPLDFPDSDRVVVIRETQLPAFPDFAVAPANFRDWERQAKSFSALTAYAGAPLNLTGDVEPVRLQGVRATANFFTVFGIKPVLGRGFLPEEDAPGKNRVVVLSHNFWSGAMAADPAIVGRTLQLNGEPHTVIGVAPPGFGRASKTDAWIPAAYTPDELTDAARGSHYVTAAGRLATGVTAAQADVEMKALAGRIAQQYPDSCGGWSAFVAPMLDYRVRDVRGALYTLVGAVGCVLLIACANVANLLLVRASARQREMSVRAALGASRARLVRQLLTESVLLACAGGAAGLFLARWGLDSIVTLAPAGIPRTEEIHLDGLVLGLALGLSLVTGILFGLAPAWLAGRTSMNEALKQGSRGSTDGQGRGRLRSSLVVAEVATALVLLVSAGLLGRSFAKLSHVDPGFVPENAVAIRLPLPEKKYDTPEKKVAFADALLGRLRTLPGVVEVGITHTIPLQGDWVEALEIEGQPKVSPAEMPATNYYGVTPGYFRAMGIRLVRGRLFTERDDVRAPKVAIVNETFVRRHFPHADPIGRRISVTTDDQVQWREIVGVVADVTQHGVDQVTPSQTYDPFLQHPLSFMIVVARLSGPTAAFLQEFRPALHAVDKDQPIGSIFPLEQILADSMARQRFAMILLSVFAAVALVIAVVGIYGVMAYNVSLRRNEIGIRLALGAQASDVLRLVLSQGGRLIAAGLVLGLVVTLLLGRFLASQLYTMKAHDPLTLGGLTLLLATVATLACLIPSWRASRLDPLTALRSD